MDSQVLELQRTGDVVAARQAGRNMARACGLGSADQTRLATAISELARNVLHYAGSGSCTIFDESNETAFRIRVVVEDAGPGIPDVELALTDGFSTGGGLGAGLPGTQRLVHTLEIDTKPGRTWIQIIVQRTRS